MRPNFIARAVACWLFFGSAAQAGVLTSATWVGDFQGTPFTLVTGGASLSASGSAAGSSISSLNLTVVAPRLTSAQLSQPPFFPPLFTSLTLGGSQTINSTNAANQGVPGSVRTFFGTTSVQSPFPFVQVPISVGVAGTFTSQAIAGAGLAFPVQITATFFPWTTGSQVFTGLTGTTTTSGGAVNMGAALPDFTAAGSNSLSGGVGSITLVAPARTQICIVQPLGLFPCGGGPFTVARKSTRATATSLTLTFAAVPEPGMVLLLGAGLVGLIARKAQR